MRCKCQDLNCASLSHNCYFAEGRRSNNNPLFLVLLPLMLILSLKTVAQAYTYQPFPDSNFTWKGYFIIQPPMGSSSYINDWTCRMKGDTTFNKLVYHIVGGLGYLREDSTKKVYYIKYADTTFHEILLYDFSLSTGDTLHSEGYNYVITAVDTPLYQGLPRRTLHVDYSGSKDVWIEGIGSSQSPIFWWWHYYYSVLYHASAICTAVQGTTTVFQKNNDTNCDQYYLDVNPISSGNLLLFPNPVLSSFTVQLSSLPSSSTYFHLYDAVGRLVNREKITELATTIQRINLPKVFTSGNYSKAITFCKEESWCLNKLHLLMPHLAVYPEDYRWSLAKFYLTGIDDFGFLSHYASGE